MSATIIQTTGGIMEQKKIDRINELARKSKTAEGLTEQEKASLDPTYKGQQTAMVI